MAIRDQSDNIFSAAIKNPLEFESPFPTDESLVSSKFLQIYGTEAPSGTGETVGEQMAVFSSGVAWGKVFQMGLYQKATSPIAGGIKTDIWHDITRGKRPGDLPDVNVFEAVQPLLGVSKPEEMMGAFAQTGFNIAVDLMSAVPVAGAILKGVVAAGRFVAMLLQKKNAKEEPKNYVAMTDYSEEVDTSLAQLILTTSMPAVDWTTIFEPPFHPNDFRLQEAKSGSGDSEQKGYIWGPFRSNGTLDRSGGYGFMPGTQKMAESVQLLTVRADQSKGIYQENLVNVGDYFPATAQMGTAAWEMAQKFGSPDMFTIKAQRLINLWTEYFNAYFAAAISEWNEDDQFEQFRLSRAMQQFILKRIPSTGFSQAAEFLGFDTPNMEWWPGMFDCPDAVGEGCKFRHENPNYWGPTPLPYRSTSNPDSYTRQAYYSRVDKALILPALRRLRDRQWSALYETDVCAFVRPDDIKATADHPFLPAHAAFKDSARGAQLAERCRLARDHLVGTAGGGVGGGYDIRYRIRLKDARAADPIFAARLQASGVRENSWMMATGELAAAPRPTWDPDSPPPPPAEPPAGGAAFSAVASQFAPEEEGRKGGAGLLLGVAALGFLLAMKNKR
jgi:hypothetical protein